MLLDFDEVPAIEAHDQLSRVGESEAPLAALALSEVEYLVGKRGRAVVVARDENAPPDPEAL